MEVVSKLELSERATQSNYSSSWGKRESDQIRWQSIQKLSRYFTKHRENINFLVVHFLGIINISSNFCDNSAKRCNQCRHSQRTAIAWLKKTECRVLLIMLNERTDVWVLAIMPYPIGNIAV